MDRIELKHVTFSYTLAENKALDDVSFTFEKGRFYGVIGENGGGKTTLCNLCAALSRISSRARCRGRCCTTGRT